MSDDDEALPEKLWGYPVLVDPRCPPDTILIVPTWLSTWLDEGPEGEEGE